MSSEPINALANTSDSAPPAPADPAPEPGSKRRWRTLMRAVVSLSLLAALLAWVDFGQLASALGNARPARLLVLLAAFMIERVLATYRWHILLRRLEPEVRFGGTLRAMLLSNFLGAMLPGTFGTDAVRVAAVGRSRANWAGATVSTAMDRLVGLLALVLIVLTAMPLSAYPLPIAAPVLAWSTAGGLTVLGIGLAHPVPARWLTRRLRRLPGLSRLAPRAFRATRRLIRQPGLLGRILSLAVVFQLVRITLAPVAAWSLGIAVPLTTFYIYMPAVLFLMMLPISMGGLGVREMSFVYFFGAGGGIMTPEAALSVSLLIAAATLLMQLPGAVVCFTGVRLCRPAAASGSS